MSNRREYILAPQMVMPWHPGKTVTVVRAAELLGCAESTVRRMIEDGSIEGFKRRKNRPNSPYVVVFQSVLDVADDWRRQTGREAPTSASSAPATNSKSGART